MKAVGASAARAHLAIQVGPALLLHGHVGPDLGEVGQVHLGHGQAHTLPALGHHGAPGVHDHGMPEAGPLDVMAADLGGGDDVGLCLYGPGPEEDLPVGQARGHGEGRGEGEELGPGPRQGLAVLGEAEVVTDS